MVKTHIDSLEDGKFGKIFIPENGSKILASILKGSGLITDNSDCENDILIH